MIGFGVVVSIDEKGCRVRVEFPDRDDGEGVKLVSNWLPVAQKKTVGDQEYWLPEEGTQVVCLMDERYEDGAVLGAIYSDADPVPVASKDLYYRRFNDGSTIVYDRAAHKLSADVKGEIEAAADVSVTVTSPLVKAVASSQVVFDTPETVCTGNLTAAGNISSTGGNVSDQHGTIQAMREVHNAHTHAEHGTGGGTTSPPTQQM